MASSGGMREGSLNRSCLALLIRYFASANTVFSWCLRTFLTFASSVAATLLSVSDMPSAFHSAQILSDKLGTSSAFHNVARVARDAT